MKTKFIKSLTIHHQKLLHFLLVYSLFFAFTLTGCYEDLSEKKESYLQVRDGEDDLDVEDILELLGESCVPEGSAGCNDIEFIDTMNISLADYTGCSFTVVFKYYTCEGGGGFDFTMGDFQILSHNCSAFTSGLNSAFTAGGATLAAFIDAFEYNILEAIETAVVNQYVQPGTFKCLEGIFFNIYYLRASCYKRCVIAFNNGSASYIKITCGVDCFQKHTRACRNTSGDLVIETYYAPASPPFCGDSPIFEGNPVLNRCIRQTSCSYSCPTE